MTPPRSSPLPAGAWRVCFAALLVLSAPTGAWAQGPPLEPGTTAARPVIARVDLALVADLLVVDPAPQPLQRPMSATAPAGLDITALPAGPWIFGAAPVTKTESLAFAVSGDRAALYFDSNGDGRLAQSERAQSPVVRQGAAWFTVQGRVAQPDGTTVHLAQIPMKVGIPLNSAEQSWSRLDAYRTGTLDLAGRSVRLAVIDRTFRGWFGHLGRDELLVDVDGDREFDTTEESHERYRLGSPFPVGDRDVVVAAVGPLGAFLDLAASEKPARRFPSLQVGALAPPLEAQDLTGRPVSLTGLAGRWVLLDFWATWCGPCRAELPNLKALREALPDVVILGLSADRDALTLQNFVASGGVTWAQVHDADGTVRAPWRVQSFPRSYLIGPDGRIAAKDLRGPGLTDAVRRLRSAAPPAAP